MQVLDFYKLSRNRMLVSVQLVRIEKMYTYKHAGSRSYIMICSYSMLKVKDFMKYLKLNPYKGTTFIKNIFLI